jgi:hypothetical protein
MSLAVNWGECESAGLPAVYPAATSGEEVAQSLVCAQIFERLFSLSDGLRLFVQKEGSTISKILVRNTVDMLISVSGQKEGEKAFDQAFFRSQVTLALENLVEKLAQIYERLRSRKLYKDLSTAARQRTVQMARIILINVAEDHPELNDIVSAAERFVFAYGQNYVVENEQSDRVRAGLASAVFDVCISSILYTVARNLTMPLPNETSVLGVRALDLSRSAAFLGSVIGRYSYKERGATLASIEALETGGYNTKGPF